MREEINTKTNNSSIKFYTSYSIKRDGELQSRAIKEVIRIIDAKEKENEFAKKKYKHKFDFADMEVRNVLKIGEVITLMIKFTHRFNHYRTRDTTINKNIINTICLRYKLIETQNHVIKY